MRDPHQTYLSKTSKIPATCEKCIYFRETKINKTSHQFACIQDDMDYHYMNKDQSIDPWFACHCFQLESHWGEEELLVMV